jgi:hypothetical protein
MCDGLISAYIMIEVLFTALMLAYQLPPCGSSLSDVARGFEARLEKLYNGHALISGFNKLDLKPQMNLAASQTVIQDVTNRPDCS